MRWSHVGWLLLIAVAVAVARERPKRHLPLLKKITSHILGANIHNKLPKEENYKLYKIPGLDHIRIKAIPKVTIKEAVPKTVIVKPVNRPIVVESDIDTKTDNVTVLQKIANLLKLCIFSDNQEEVLREVIVPINSHHNTIKYTETETNEQYEVKSPGFPEVRKPEYVVPTISGRHTETVNIIQRKPVAVAIPPISVIPGQVKISEVVRSTVPTKYSYKQTSQDGAVTTYESEGNPNVVVTKTATIPVLPPYIKVRIQEAAAIGVNPLRVIQPKPAFPAYPLPVDVLSIPRPSSIGVITSPGALIKESIVPLSLPPFNSQYVSAKLPPGFKIHEKSGYLTGYDAYGPQIVVRGDENPTLFSAPIPLPPDYPQIIDISKPKLITNGKVNVNVSKKHKAITSANPDMHGGETSSNDLTSQSKDSNNYESAKRVVSYKGIAVPPASRINSSPSSMHATNELGSTFGQSAIGNLNEALLNGPAVSKYSYKQINHNNANPFTEVEVRDKAKFDANKQHNEINMNTNSDSIPNSYLYVPPTKGNIEHPPVNIRANICERLYKYQDTTYNAKEDDCLTNDGNPKQRDQLITKDSDNLNRNPIVVPDDEKFVYRQKNADGSSISIKGNAQNTVSVHIEDSKNASNQDGNESNIPDAKF